MKLHVDRLAAMPAAQRRRYLQMVIGSVNLDVGVMQARAVLMTELRKMEVWPCGPALR